MNVLDRVIAGFSPQRGAARLRARVAMNGLLAANAHYDASSFGNRTSSWKASSTDADAASGRRGRISFVARDMVRNNAFATRAQMVITNNVVGSGIIPKIVTKTPKDSVDAVVKPNPLLAEGLSLIECHFDTTAIDVDGRQNLYGLQRIVANTIVESGEILVVRSTGNNPTSSGLDLQIKLLEPDYLDTGMDGRAVGENTIHEGIEYDPNGGRVAYHLFDEHPGTSNWRRGRMLLTSKRILASDVLHIYRQDRAGQNRGVSWFAPVMMLLQDLADYQDAQLMRQKIAACFTAFHKVSDVGGAAAQQMGNTLMPGTIQTIGVDDEITFANPPDVGGFDEFTRGILRAVASAMGITAESLTGDLSKVNFSSGRMGRMEMDRSVEAWQWLMMIPLMMQPIGEWFKKSWAKSNPTQARQIMALKMDWVPPHRILVDPSREIAALADGVAAGFTSRLSVVRQLGNDPERLNEEIIADRKWAKYNDIIFNSDARHTVKAVADADRMDAIEKDETNG